MEPFNFIGLCKTNFFEVELFDHLTMCRQMIDI